MLFHTRPPRALASDTALHSGLHSGLHHHQIDLLQEYPSLPPLPLPCSHQQHKRDHTHLSAWSSQQSIASMRKLFGQKIKTPKSASSNDIYIAPPENHNVYSTPPRSSSDDHWDLVSHESATISSPYTQTQRPPSPFNTNVSVHSLRSNGYREQQPQQLQQQQQQPQQTLRKKPPTSSNPTAAVGILRALDPHPDVQQHQYHLQQQQHRERSDDNQTEFSFKEDRYTYSSSPSIPVNKEEKKEKKGFWDRAKERHQEGEKERQKAKERERREDDSQAELTRMIGFLTATASEDWTLVLEVCERASATETGAKETAKALRREFKYAEPPAQLSAARLWAILLRNASQTFVAQCASRKFLETVEDVVNNSRTSPVVRERLLQVLAAAAFYNPPRHKNEKDGFRPVWRKLKDPSQPDEGIPFDTEDSMLNPPIPTFAYPSETTPQVPSPKPPIAPPSSKQRSQQRIIPPEEDMRRLFQECKVGKGNASLLSEALAFAKPQDLKNKPVIKEFYARCRASQELIYAQIPWASAGAERSRAAAAAATATATATQESTVGTGGGAAVGRRLRKGSPTNKPRQLAATNPDEPPTAELTQEEQLLAALLSANEELTSALRVYEELERLKIEKETEERSKKETRMGSRRPPVNDESDSSAHRSSHFSHAHGTRSHSHAHTQSGPPSSPSPSPSPSPAPSSNPTPKHPPSIVSNHPHPLPPIPPSTPTVPAQNLAPPPHAPFGPRYPSQNNGSVGSVGNISRSRSPSPDKVTSVRGHENVTPPLAPAQLQLHANHGSVESWDREKSVASGRTRDRDRGQSNHGHGHSSALSGSKDSFAGLDTARPPEIDGPPRLSEKAMGKRKQEPDELDNAFDPNDIFHDRNNESPSETLEDFDSDESAHAKVHYVYDAAAERTKERIREGMIAAKLVPGVH